MWIPFAVKETVPTLDHGSRFPNRAVMLHTAVTSVNDLYAYYKNSGTSIGAHLYVAKDGTLYQYVDTARQCYHAFDANTWTFGIETWDNSDPAHTPWTEAQLNTIVKVLVLHDIPAQPLACLPSNGVGYHRQCDSWNKSKHSCPGDPRVAQVPLIIARLKEEYMALDALAKDLGTDSSRLKHALLELLGIASRVQGTGRPVNATVAEGFDWAAKADAPAGPHNHDLVYSKLGHGHAVPAHGHAVTATGTAK